MKLQTHYEYMMNELALCLKKEKFEETFDNFEKNVAPVFIMEIRAYSATGQYVYTAVAEKDRGKAMEYLEFLRETETPSKELRDLGKLISEDSDYYDI